MNEREMHKCTRGIPQDVQCAQKIQAKPEHKSTAVYWMTYYLIYQRGDHPNNTNEIPRAVKTQGSIFSSLLTQHLRPQLEVLVHQKHNSIWPRVSRLIDIQPIINKLFKQGSNEAHHLFYWDFLYFFIPSFPSVQVVLPMWLSFEVDLNGVPSHLDNLLNKCLPIFNFTFVCS